MQPADAPMTASVLRLAREWLEVVASSDFDAWKERVDANVVFRFPFAPDPMPTVLHGFDAARSALSSWANASWFEWSDTRFIPAAEDGVVTVLTHAKAELKNGSSYENDYVIVLSFRCGMLVEHVEYFDPQRLPAMS